MLLVTVPRLFAALAAATGLLALLGYTAVLGTGGRYWLAASATCALFSLILTMPKEEL